MDCALKLMDLTNEILGLTDKARIAMKVIFEPFLKILGILVCQN